MLDSLAAHAHVGVPIKPHLHGLKNGFMLPA
jgi:hypothetical protein